MVDIVKDETTYKTTLRPEARTEALFTLGGKGDRFVPNINISKWDNEYFININARDCAVINEREGFTDNKISLTIGQVTHEMWPLPNEKALEYRLTFLSPPHVNTINLDILCSQDLSWHYQPELTQAEIDLDNYRPDNVINSYAVYGAKQGNKYRAGKFCHVYRWQLTDADDKTAWAEQKITFEPTLTLQDHRKGVLTLALPPDFMASARYPVQLMGRGDTFGIEAAGASEAGLENTIYAAVDAPAAGTTTQISAYIRESNTANAHKFKCALYTDSSDALLSASAEHANDQDTSWAWVNFAISQAITAVPIAIAIFCDAGAGAGRTMYDVQAGEGRAGDGAGDDYALGFPDPVSWGGGGDPVGRRYSIHCDYTTGGGELTKDLSDTINLSDACVFLLGLNKSDSISLSDSQIKNIGRPLTDTVSISDGIAKNIGLPESDSISMSDGIMKAPGLSKADTIILSDNASIVVAFLRSLNDTINLSDNIVKEMGLSKADTITLSDNLVSMIRAILMSLSDTVNLSDDIIKNIGTVQADTINLTDEAVKNFGITKADTITISDNLTSMIIAIIMNLGDTINLSDDIVKNVGTVRADTINISDNFGKVIAYLRSFADTITLSDLGLREAGLNKADAVTLSDSVTKEPRLSKTDIIALSDSIAKEMGLNKADTITLSDFFSSDAEIILAIGKIIATITGRGPGATITGRGPGATITGRGPSSTITGK